MDAHARPARLSAFARLLAALCSMAGGVGAFAQVDQPAAHASQDSGSDNLDQVVVTAKQLFDTSVLDHLIIPRFIQSHAAPTVAIDQLSRWANAVCPQTTGLQPIYNEIVSRRVLAVARGVGAPASGDFGKCRVNVEIVFSTSPQELLAHIAKAYPILLGSARSANDTQLHRAVQAWYLTGTRSKVGYQPPHPTRSASAMPDPNAAGVLSGGGVWIDPPKSAGAGLLMPSGIADSRLGKGLVSEFQHVLVVVDSSKAAPYSFTAVADHIAMISLTRSSSLDACSELPSIIDLLSAGCRSRAPPGAVTEADTAFLRALYSSDLEHNMNVERGDLHDRMLTSLVTHDR